MNRRITLYIAMSLDWFIAKENGSVDWLDKFNSPNDDYWYKAFLDSVNTVIMWNTTYKQILSFGEFPYKNKNCYVFAKEISEDKNVKFVNWDVRKFIENLDLRFNKNIWLVGGADIVNQFLRYNLIDEFIIFIMPIILWEGIRLFDKDNKELSLVVKNTKSYDSGVIQISYEKDNFEEVV